MATLFTNRVSLHGTSRRPEVEPVPFRAIACAAVILTLLAACASAPPDRVALNTLKSLRVTAESAVSVFKAGRAQVPPLFTDAQEAQARDLYFKYLAADKAAAQAIYAGTNLSTANVAQAVADILAFVNTLTKKGP